MSNIEITAETPRNAITISGIVMQCPAPFAEGHVLRANEASVLNQTYGENVRNNLSKMVKEAVDKAKAEDDEVDVPTLQAKLDEYVQAYDFGVRIGGSPKDPVEAEAFKLAGARVRDALRQKGYVLKDVPKDQLNGLINDALEKYPAFREQAKAVVAARAGAVEDLQLDLS